jgi:hypothetical protein
VTTRLWRGIGSESLLPTDREIRRACDWHVATTDEIRAFQFRRRGHAFCDDCKAYVAALRRMGKLHR